MRVNDKVMIPQDEHPEINFVGLLIGPRGNTLKNLEKDVRFRSYHYKNDLNKRGISFSRSFINF